MVNIVFDLDGTLVDSAPSLSAAGNALLAELGRPPVTAETYKGFVGHGMKRQVEQLLTHSGGIPGDLAGFITRFRAFYEADPVSKTRPYTGVRETLEALKAAGHSLGVCTQKPVGPARMVLSGLGLSPYFDGLTGGDSLNVMKPDPAMLHHTLAQMPPGPVIYVGDSETDGETARNAGVPFLLHLDGYRKSPPEAIPHTASFADWGQVPGLVAGLGIVSGGGATLRLG